MFLPELLIGAGLICLTIVIHAVVLDRAIGFSERFGRFCYRHFRQYWRIPLLTSVVLLIFCSHVLHIWIWALFYLSVGALDNLELALYFSTTCYTTLGLGDIVLDEDWRLISSFEAANGIIMFGWSAAFIFEIMSQLYKDEHIQKRIRQHEKP